MKNYTKVINRVLLDWLDDKGWEIEAIHVEIRPGRFTDRGYVAGVWYSKNNYEEILRITQSELDAATPKTPRKGGAVHITDNHLVNFIRAELERQVEGE